MVVLLHLLVFVVDALHLLWTVEELVVSNRLVLQGSGPEVSQAAAGERLACEVSSAVEAEM
jgi:hypothetical protein